MDGLATAVIFTWFGMVLAISFIEAPLKFRAPGVTLALGLGIGRLVFRALNLAEVVLAVLLAVAFAAGGPAPRVGIPAVLAGVCLVVQLALLRPALNRRTQVVIAGQVPPPSRVHLGYVGLEGVKVLALLVAGALAVS